MNRRLLKPHAPLFEWPVRVIDPLIVVLAGAISYRIYLDAWDAPEYYVLAVLGMAVFCAPVFAVLGLYAPQRGVTLFEEVRRLANAWLLMAAAWFAFLFLSKSGPDYSRVWSLYWLGLGFVGHFGFRGSLRLVLRALRRRGYNLRHIVIVGAGPLGREVVRRLAHAPWSGIAVRGFYDDDPMFRGKVVEGVAVLGTIDQMVRDLDTSAIDQVWIALPLRAEARIRSVLDDLRHHAVQVRFVPDIVSFTLLRHSITEISGLPVISITESPLEGVNHAIKRIEDLVLSALIIVAASPVMLLIALGVKLSSPGPMLYRQTRVTWNGRQFQMLKFRTMPVGTESADQAVWAKPGERRATPLGSFLRRFSLDELPQFLNVLRGEMSIVGPRPERPEFVQRFRQEIPGYMQKHLVNAGITGWAQVNDLRGDTDLHDRIRYDLYYIENWSLWFDLRIMLLTLLHVLRSRNAY